MAYHTKRHKFGRERDQRNQLRRSLARSVILHEKVQTTIAKAKWIKPYIEKIVTKAVNNNLETRRSFLSKFNNDKEVVDKLLITLGPKYKERKGGYLRVVKIESRLGTGRTTAIIEFI